MASTDIEWFGHLFNVINKQEQKNKKYQARMTLHSLEWSHQKVKTYQDRLRGTCLYTQHEKGWEVTGSLVEGQFRLHCETMSQNSSIHSRKIAFVGKAVQTLICWWWFSLENSTEVSKEIKRIITIQYPSEYIPKEMKSLLHKHICMFISLYYCSQWLSLDFEVKKSEQTKMET